MRLQLNGFCEYIIEKRVLEKLKHLKSTLSMIAVWSSVNEDIHK
jgi:hypothetical protein